jgi:hypothetical protein
MLPALDQILAWRSFEVEKTHLAVLLDFIMFAVIVIMMALAYWPAGYLTT